MQEIEEKKNLIDKVSIFFKENKLKNNNINIDYFIDICFFFFL